MFNYWLGLRSALAFNTSLDAVRHATATHRNFVWVCTIPKITSCDSRLRVCHPIIVCPSRLVAKPATGDQWKFHFSLRPYKMKELDVDKAKCDQFKRNDKINPITGKKIKKNGPTYKRLLRACGSETSKSGSPIQTPTETQCLEWIDTRRDNINPITGVKITEAEKDVFEKACGKHIKRLVDDKNCFSVTPWFAADITNFDYACVKVTGIEGSLGYYNDTEKKFCCKSPTDTYSKTMTRERKQKRRRERAIRLARGLLISKGVHSTFKKKTSHIRASDIVYSGVSAMVDAIKQVFIIAKDLLTGTFHWIRDNPRMFSLLAALLICSWIVDGAKEMHFTNERMLMNALDTIERVVKERSQNARFQIIVDAVGWLLPAFQGVPRGYGPGFFQALPWG